MRKITLRVLDRFFCEGINALFKVALAIFKLNEGEILGLRESSEIIELLKRNIEVDESIFTVAGSDVDALSVAAMRSHRSASHKSLLVSTLEDDTRQAKLAEICADKRVLCTPFIPCIPL